MLFQYTILGPIFWMLLGIIQLAFFIGLNLYFKDKGIGLSKLKWGLIACWWFTLNISVAAAFTLIGENEPKAGIYFLAFFGVTLLICGAALWTFIHKKAKTTIK